MANKSSRVLEESLTSRVDVGYSYASGTTPKDKDFERVKEEMRNVDIDWFGSNVFTELSNKVQPVKDHIAKYYPNVTFESDKLDHYAVSLMLAEKSNREVSFGIGFLKEVMDIAGTGFSQGDLDADLAGAMGWDVQQALSAGLLIDQNPTNTDAYNEWKKIPEYLDPNYNSQSNEDATTGQNYFNNIRTKINPRNNANLQRALTGNLTFSFSGTPTYGAHAAVELTSDYGGYYVTVANASPTNSGGWSGEGLVITATGPDNSGPWDVTLNASYLVGGIGGAPDFYVYPSFSITGVNDLDAELRNVVFTLDGF